MIIGKLHFSANNPNIVVVLLDQSYVMPLQIMITQINNEMCILIINCGTWLPAWWAPWLLWWPLTDAAMFQCVYRYLQSVFFFLVLFHCCILLEIKLTTTVPDLPWLKKSLLVMSNVSDAAEPHASCVVVYLWFFYPRPVLAFGYCRCLRLSVCVCVHVCGKHLLVRMITHHPFKLGSPNLDHRCKRPWLRSLLFCGVIDLGLQGQI